MGHTGVPAVPGRVDGTARPVLAAGHQVAVGAELQRGVLVAEPLRDGDDGLPRRQEQRGDVVPQRVSGTASC